MTKELSGHPESIKITAPFKPAAGSPWTIATNDTLTAWSGPWAHDLRWWESERRDVQRRWASTFWNREPDDEKE